MEVRYMYSGYHVHAERGEVLAATKLKFAPFCSS